MIGKEVEYITDEQRVRVTVMILVGEADRLRMDVLSPVDTLIQSMATIDGRFALLDVSGNRYLHGLAGACNVARILPVGLGPADAGRVLRGGTPLIDAEEAEVAWDEMAGAERLRLRGKDGSTQEVVLVGARGTQIYTRTFVVGMGGYWLITPADRGGMPGRALRMAYGGLEAEYIHKTAELVHLTAELLIGAGAGWLTGDGPGSSADVFVVAEPGLNVELNVAAPFRIGAGAGYRFVAGTSLPVVESSALNGFVATLTLKFGRF